MCPPANPTRFLHTGRTIVHFHVAFSAGLGGTRLYSTVLLFVQLHKFLEYTWSFLEYQLFVFIFFLHWGAAPL